jgi:hypothetical protein
MNHSVEEVFNILTGDKDFVNTINDHIKSIIYNGEIDLLDIPDFIELVVEIYNKMDKRLTYNDLPLLIERIVMDTIEKTTTMEEETMKRIRNAVQKSIKLVMFKPIVQKNVTSCFSKIFPCCFSASAVAVNDPIKDKNKVKSALKKPETELVATTPATNNAAAAPANAV